MSNPIGFVFDQPNVGCHHSNPYGYNGPTGSYSSQPQMGIMHYGQFHPPCPPPLPHFSHLEKSTPVFYPVTGAQMAPPFQEGSHCYPTHHHVNPYDSGPQNAMAKTTDDAYGNHHNNKNGIPGGKLGVVGGAVIAGAGAALATKMLPKKMKKNKLVKYGLPLAGAGAAGYKLNQMNNEGKHN